MPLRDVYAKPLASLDDLGGQLAFHLGVLKAVPRSVTRYPREIMRISSPRSPSAPERSPSSAARSA
jgi:hypothetical protein